MTDHIILSKPLEDLEVGDQIRFIGPESGSHSSRWWQVAAADQRYIIAWRQVPFQPQDTTEYTVIDQIEREHAYNGVGPGIVRSSLNTLGGGYDMRQPDWAVTMLSELHDGTWELSNRRLMQVYGVEVKAS
jgi:hypothetical protein